MAERETQVKKSNRSRHRWIGWSALALLVVFTLFVVVFQQRIRMSLLTRYAGQDLRLLEGWDKSLFDWLYGGIVSEHPSDVLEFEPSYLWIVDDEAGNSYVAMFEQAYMFIRLARIKFYDFNGREVHVIENAMGTQGRFVDIHFSDRSRFGLPCIELGTTRRLWTTGVYRWHYFLVDLNLVFVRRDHPNGEVMDDPITVVGDGAHPLTPAERQLVQSAVKKLNLERKPP